MGAVLRFELLFLGAAFARAAARAAVQADCKAGQAFNAAGGGSCAACAAGKYVAAAAQTACIDCPKGTYLVDAGTAASKHDALADCTVCSTGKYKDVVKQVTDTCISCPLGMYIATFEAAAQLHEESLDFASAVAKYDAALELFDTEPNRAASAERERLTDLRSAAHKLQLEAEAKQAEDQRLAAVAAATAKAEKCLIKSKWTGEISLGKAPPPHLEDMVPPHGVVTQGEHAYKTYTPPALFPYYSALFPFYFTE